MSTSGVNEMEKFTFLWRIENFHLLPQQNQNCLTSPIFNVKTFENTKWNLQLFPKGYCPDDLEYVSCVLKRQPDDDGPEEIKIFLQLTSNSISFSGTSAFKKGEVRGYQQFISLNSEFLNNCFIIEACMTLIQDTVKDTGSTKKVISPFVPSFLKMDSLSNELSEKIYLVTENQLEKSLKNVWICPTYCFANSRVLVEKRSIICSLGDLFKSGSNKNELHFPVVSFSQVPPLLITLQKTVADCEYFLEIDISLLDDLEKPLLSSCNVTLLDASGIICKTLQDIHLFQFGHGKEIWNFGKPIKWNSLNNCEHITSLHFKFVFSHGQISSNIEWSSELDCSSSKDPKPIDCNISKELYRFYTEGKFCNVILKTKDKNIKAHKIILCASSPVFAAMFESGMNESDTNVVNIDDIDSDTLSNLLQYMYTGDIEKFDFSLATNLYSAADKYALENLKLMCRFYLKNNLNIKNLCGILLLADAHHDNQLKESAVDFLSIHKNDILFSREWEEFTSKYVLLANKILLTLCLK